MMAVLQAVVTGGVLFLLYRYLLKTIGAEQIGIWAIVLATASASRISEMGFAGSVVKFTAKYIARGDQDKAAEVVQTTYITIGVSLMCILVVGYPFISWIMGKLVPTSQVAIARAILPIALLSVWTGGASGVFLGGLDGCQRIDLRAFIAIFAGSIFLILTWILVPKFGLFGLAWAQIGQGTFMLLAGRILLQRELPSLPWLPHGWRYSVFKEMLQYGLNFQVTSVFSMLFEPTTKALMAVFGGLASTAYYEMAHRMVVQFRSLLVSANQVIVPRVAVLQETEPEKVRKAYLESYRMLFFLALPLFAGVAAFTPLASEVWIGRYEPCFVGYSLLLVAGWWLNTLSAPAYFINLGTGLLFWNTLGHVTIGVLNVVLGYLLGLAFGSVGVVLGYVLALVVGSSLIAIRYQFNNGIALRELLPRENRKLFIVCCAGALMGFISFYCFKVPSGALKGGLSLAIYILTIAFAFWKHPLRTKIGMQIGAVLARRTSVTNLGRSISTPLP
ncbi:MAG: lipopolysaccharide biosynthesis protein [Candidatus Gracilibacteria bacterium]|nr:lipopolysaccharide biosynthesis protein [Candidatus Gracilibacteria bacterium]